MDWILISNFLNSGLPNFFIVLVVGAVALIFVSFCYADNLDCSEIDEAGESKQALGLIFYFTWLRNLGEEEN